MEAMLVGSSTTQNHAMIARGIGAVGAGVNVGDVVAHRAQPQLGFQITHRCGKQFGVFVARTQDMKRQPLRGLGSNPRQFLQLFNQPRHRLGKTAHGALSISTSRILILIRTP